MTLRSLTLLIAMAISAALAIQLTPDKLYSHSHYRDYSLNRAIPTQFGDWHLDEAGSRAIVSPDMEQELAKFYSETVSRTYVNSKGDRVMLSLAYGGDQGRALQVHKPEVCYEAQGFKITYDNKARIHSSSGEVPVRRLVAIQGPRTEPITYWIRSGDTIVTGWYEQNKARLKAGLFDGLIADGLLVRVSTLTSERDQAYKVHDEFIADLLAHTKALDHDMLLGSSHKTDRM